MAEFEHSKRRPDPRLSSSPRSVHMLVPHLVSKFLNEGIVSFDQDSNRPVVNEGNLESLVQTFPFDPPAPNKMGGSLTKWEADELRVLACGFPKKVEDIYHFTVEVTIPGMNIVEDATMDMAGRIHSGVRTTESFAYGRFNYGIYQDRIPDESERQNIRVEVGLQNLLALPKTQLFRFLRLHGFSPTKILIVKLAETIGHEYAHVLDTAASLIAVAHERQSEKRSTREEANARNHDLLLAKISPITDPQKLEFMRGRRLGRQWIGFSEERLSAGFGILTMLNALDRMGMDQPTRDILREQQLESAARRALMFIPTLKAAKAHGFEGRALLDGLRETQKLLKNQEGVRAKIVERWVGEALWALNPYTLGGSFPIDSAQDIAKHFMLAKIPYTGEIYRSWNFD